MHAPSTGGVRVHASSAGASVAPSLRLIMRVTVPGPVEAAQACDFGGLRALCGRSSRGGRRSCGPLARIREIGAYAGSGDHAVCIRVQRFESSESTNPRLPRTPRAFRQRFEGDSLAPLFMLSNSSSAANTVVEEWQAASVVRLRRRKSALPSPLYCLGASAGCL